ncbi:MAG: hypothetical protein ACI4GD_00490 [Lachnospiraceae bacterium]
MVSREKDKTKVIEFLKSSQLNHDMYLLALELFGDRPQQYGYVASFGTDERTPACIRFQ